MEDRDIINQAYAELVKEFFSTFHVTGDKTRFKELVELARRRRDEALDLL